MNEALRITPASSPPPTDDGRLEGCCLLLPSLLSSLIVVALLDEKVPLSVRKNGRLPILFSDNKQQQANPLLYCRFDQSRHLSPSLPPWHEGCTLHTRCQQLCVCV
ncbi:unnamed protein product, partial [Ectocarpus sp. 12 AP-2014]